MADKKMIFESKRFEACRFCEWNKFSINGEQVKICSDETARKIVCSEYCLSAKTKVQINADWLTRGTNFRKLGVDAQRLLRKAHRDANDPSRRRGPMSLRQIHIECEKERLAGRQTEAL